MRIGILTSVHTQVLKYCVEDLEWGFNKIGHKVEVFREDSRWCDYDGDQSTAEDFIDFLDDWQPELMVQFDGLRTNHPYAGVPDDIPWVCWVLDRLPWLQQSRYIKPLYKNVNITLAIFPELRRELIEQGYPADMTHTMTLGVNTDLFNLTPELPQSRFCCEIGFCTRLISQMPDSRKRTRMAAAMEAISTGRRVHLYGDGWKEEGEPWMYHYQGKVDPRRELKACFQQADLTLHANEDTHWHMRVLECIASGGRIASYDCHGKPRSYPYPMVALFKTSSDLERIVKEIQWSRAEDSHRQTSEWQHEWIRKNHGYDVKARRILELVEDAKTRQKRSAEQIPIPVSVACDCNWRGHH